jgi:trans-aconitate methyltransferase
MRLIVELDSWRATSVFQVHRTIDHLTSAQEWNAAAYHRVSDPQFAWGQAVLARLPLRGDERVVDAGCGTGRLTKEVAACVPHGVIVGLDASRQMLGQARAHLADASTRIHLVEALLPAMPIGNWADVVFSTATFHWVPDHPALFANIFEALRPGGLLQRTVRRSREPSACAHTSRGRDGDAGILAVLQRLATHLGICGC